MISPEEDNVGIGIACQFSPFIQRLSFHALSGPEFSDQRSRVAPRQEPLFGWLGTHLEGIACSREVDGGANNGISAQCPAADDRSCMQNGSSLCRLSRSRTRRSTRHSKSAGAVSRNRSQQSA